MAHDLYAAMATPTDKYHANMVDESMVEEVETASQIDRVFRMDSSVEGGDRNRVQFNGVTMSDRSSRVSRSEMGRSLARVYDPTLQERAQHFLEGPSGLYLELVNLAFSMIIFGLYVTELYYPTLNGASVKRAVEASLTSFFIFDLGLHLFVAPNPVQYMLSIYGVIDLVTIVPSFLVYFARSNKSQTFFILRVLRIFRALRVLRLKRFITFKRHGFNYELSVFILSSVAVILCAAGLYHAMEEAHYLGIGESFHFHEALYFILVTMSTVGYGDISPQTTLGEIFVMLLIIAVFTIVPQKAAKLNDLAKQNHQYDKAYTRKNNKKPGHVIVSGYDLTPDSIWDFLDEFYHASRGKIHLDVVFMCEAPPSAAVLRLLSQERFVRRTRYLRGSLSNGNDQKRARLSESTAVFFLANKLVRRESAQQDARTVLHTLAVRNFADSSGIHLDIYMQMRSREQELETTAQLLGSNTTNTSELQTMILSRAAVCPGASTLILNLLYSASAVHYTSTRTHTKYWIEEYVDGMSHQIFPIIFTKRFQYEKYDDVVRNIYERYNVMLIMVRPRRRRRPSNRASTTDPEFRIAPFQYFIREGDIGIVLAKTAAKVLHIANSYGFWNEAEHARSGSSPRQAQPVRVSSDSLMKRPSPRSRLHNGKSALSLLERSRSFNCRDGDAKTENSTGISSHLNLRLGYPASTARVSSFANVSRIENIHETSFATHTMERSSETCVDMPIVLAVRGRKLEAIQECLERDHFLQNADHLQGHFIICGGRLRDALTVVAFIKRFCKNEKRLRSTSHALSPLGSLARFSSAPPFVLLVEEYPAARDLAKVLTTKEGSGEDIGNVLQDVKFVCGSATKVADLRKTAMDRACRVIMMPSPTGAASKFKIKAVPSPMTSSPSEAQTLSHENLSDFGVINALLVSEVVREDMEMGFSGRRSPRRRQSSRQHLHSQGVDSAESALGFYRREIEQGLPLESIKIRMLERYPDLEPTMFNQLPDVIETSLLQYDSDGSVVEQSGCGCVGVTDGTSQCDQISGLDEIHTVALLYHASSAKFCRPRDPAVSHDEFPCLAPSFAGGDVMLASILDRIVCQAFYNPYVTDVVRVLACGEDEVPLPTDRATKSDAPGKPSASSTRSRRLFQVTIDESYAGADFVSAFQDFLAMNMLVIGVLRACNPALQNLRPFVYTCPTPETTLHLHDKLFVLG